MIKAGIDQDALIRMFSDASAKQGEALRNAGCRCDAERPGGPRADDGEHQEGAKAMQAMLDSYAALAGGVLIGMSEGLQATAAPAPVKVRARS
jgi:hypothetical protein